MNMRPDFLRLRALIFAARASISKSLILLGLIIAMTCLGAGVLVWVNDSTRSIWLGENQIIESLSAWMYLLVAILLVFVGFVQWLSKSSVASRSLILHPWLLAVFTACFAAREMDFHSRFTGGSVLKTSYYLRADHSWLAKLIPLLVMTAIAVLVLRVASHYRHILLRRWQAGEMLGVLPVTAFILVGFSKGIDAGMGTLLRNEWITSLWVGKISTGIEEISELFIPCLFFCMFCLALAKRFSHSQKQKHGKNGKSGINDSSGNTASPDLPMAA